MGLWYRFLNYINPRPYFWRRPFAKPLELYRCNVDRRLLTMAMMNAGICGGHRIGQPAYPTISEFILIWTGLIR